MKNVGKIFEKDFEKSVPDYCFLYRVPDMASIIWQSKYADVARSPYDYQLFDTKNRVFYTLELKSTCNTNISFELLDDENNTKRMIHRHQILALLETAKYKNIISGFILNFRNRNDQRTYFFNIDDFMKLYYGIGKRSFNESDIISYGGIPIDGKKKISHYVWDIDKLLSMKEVNKNE